MNDTDVRRQLFAKWMSVPAGTRVPKTQGEWAAQNGVSREWCSRQKADPEFKRLVADEGLDWFSADDLNEIILAVKIKAKEGNVPAATMCLKMAGVLDDGRKRDEEADVSKMPELSDADLERLAAGEGLR